MINIEQHLNQLREGLPPPATAGYFGSELSIDQAQLVLFPVSFDATTSYRRGTHRTPAAMRIPSHQLDLFDRTFGPVYRVGISQYLDSQYQDDVQRYNDKAGLHAQKVITAWEDGEKPMDQDLEIVNQSSFKLNELVRQRTSSLLRRGKLIGLVGGDHSVPFGYLQALASMHSDFGIIHMDAHHDLRVAYEGFQHSHASIMYNVMENIPQVSQLLSIGIRDFSEDEWRYAHDHPAIQTLYYDDLFSGLATGRSFADLLEARLAKLPEKVYISFDIDGLDPALCPGTGTPVPGGLSYSQALWILERLHQLGKTLVGFDLCEINQAGAGDAEYDDWDFNVGSRILYKLCGLLAASNQIEPLA